MDEKLKADPNNIRKMKETDVGRVSEIWLKEIKRAHPLICDKFWDSRLSTFEGEIKRANEKYVYEKDDKIVGFIMAWPVNNSLYISELS